MSMDAITRLERRRYEIDNRRTDLLSMKRPIDKELVSLSEERRKIQDEIT